MATRRGSWDDRFPRYVPAPALAADGIATSKQRGAMAASWWSQRFVDVLESYGLGARMQRGRVHDHLCGHFAAIGQPDNVRIAATRQNGGVDSGAERHHAACVLQVALQGQHEAVAVNDAS